MFSLREREENVMKGGVNSFGRKHGNKHAKHMKMEGGEDVPGGVLPGTFGGGCVNPRGVFQGNEGVIGPK